MSVMRHRDIEATGGKLFGDQFGHGPVVVDAKNFLACFCHAPPLPQAPSGDPRQPSIFLESLRGIHVKPTAAVNCEKTRPICD
jgi:hypothetical protein